MTRKYRHAKQHSTRSLPSLADATTARSPIALKNMQSSVWDAATVTYRPGHEQMVHVGWMYGGGDNGTEWSTTADAFWPHGVTWPGSLALVYTGFTGLPDYLKPFVPEILVVVVPLRLADGQLVGDPNAIVVRSVTCAARGDLGHAVNRDPMVYARQFHYGRERSFMHSAYCFAAQYLAALRGNAGYIERTMQWGLPTPTMCNLISRGAPNQNGVLPAPEAVPVSDLTNDDERLLREQYVGGNVEQSLVLDVSKMGSGADILSGELTTVDRTSPWRVFPGHVRSIMADYGADSAARTGCAVVDVRYSVR